MYGSTTANCKKNDSVATAAPSLLVGAAGVAAPTGDDPTSSVDAFDELVVGAGVGVDDVDVVDVLKGDDVVSYVWFVWLLPCVTFVFRLSGSVCADRALPRSARRSGPRLWSGSTAPVACGAKRTTHARAASTTHVQHARLGRILPAPGLGGPAKRVQNLAKGLAGNTKKSELKMNLTEAVHTEHGC